MTPLPKLSAPACRALTAAGVAFLEDLSRISRKEAAKLHGMGPNALTKLDAALAEAGLAWRQE
ncbi:MAG: DNA-binding protein [Armatimonadetes bacterium]|nr:DNA-binding protein [Armatimonadota bacterium]